MDLGALTGEYLVSRKSDRVTDVAIDAKLIITSVDPERYPRIGGFDSMIVRADDADISSLSGTINGHFVDSNSLTPKLVRYSHMAAARIGEKLHHADWTITDDQARVQELTLMHDCPTCRAGCDQALSYMRDSGKAVLVGQLYWVHPDDY